MWNTLAVAVGYHGGGMAGKGVKSMVRQGNLRNI
jgi:hypothetical protein